MARSTDPNDPSGLIAEAYRIEDITPIECRSIFFDWVVGLPGAAEPALASLLARFSETHPDHPMTAVLREGKLTEAPHGARPRTGRRG